MHWQPSKRRERYFSFVLKIAICVDKVDVKRLLVKCLLVNVRVLDVERYEDHRRKICRVHVC